MRRVSQRQGRNHLVGRKRSRYSNDRLTGCCVFDRDKPLFPSIGDFDVLVQRVRQLEEYIKTNGTLQLGQGTVPRIRSVERQSHFSELHPVLHQVPSGSSDIEMLYLAQPTTAPTYYGRSLHRPYNLPSPHFRIELIRQANEALLEKETCRACNNLKVSEIIISMSRWTWYDSRRGRLPQI
jgi:hypothetical protein